MDIKPQGRRLVTTLLLTFVLSVWVDSGRPTQGVFTGTVVEFRRNQSISVTRHAADRSGIQFLLRRRTAYELRDDKSVDPIVIRSGVRVTVWYRLVGERRPVADKVRVLPVSEKG